MTDAIVVEGLAKRFGATTALDGVDLTVAEGSVLGLLGPNGAGKTTVVRILTTLLLADAGRAEVVGLDGVPRGFPIVGEPLVVAAPGLSAPLEAALLEALD